MSVVTIPSIGESNLLADLALGIRAAGHAVRVVCNRPERVAETRRQAGMPVIEMPGAGIYEVWNSGIEAAATGDGIAVILNDDIAIHPLSVARVVQRCAEPGVGIVGWDYLHFPPHSGPWSRPVYGTFREGGLGGFAFAIKASTGVRCDTRFGWWGGDDDLVWSMIASGHSCLIVEEGVYHEASTSGNRHPEVMASTGADRNLLQSKWGKSW